MGRRLGQHFLVDPAILDRIVDEIDPGPQDDVVEIGSGRGTLTKRLAPRVRSVVAIEKDEVLAAALQNEGIERCTVVRADALEVDWRALLTVPGGSVRGQGLFKVVGNIPYSITTPLIDKALTQQEPAVVVFLVQREVADRLAATPGSKAYGALSVGVQALATVECLFVVRAGSFQPPPRVDSSVVRIDPRGSPLVEPGERAQFRRFVTVLFGQRRKQLRRSVRTVSRRPVAEVTQVLQSLSIDPELRPEVLTPHEFVRLFRALRR